MATYAELVKKIDELKAEAETQRISELAAAIAEVKKKIAAYNLTAKDLGLDRKGNGNTSSKKSTRSAAVKYRHPENQNLVWSGRGRQPRWMAAWISEGAGRKADDLLINQ